MQRTLGTATQLTKDDGSPYPGDAALAGPLEAVPDALSALYDAGFLHSVDDTDLGLRIDIFEPARIAVVVGRSQDIFRVVNASVAGIDGIPIHRRRGGGGAVVLAPGMLVIAVSGRSAGRFDVHTPFERVQGPIRDVLSRYGLSPRTAGVSDLALGARKILGSSLYQTKDRWSYQGVLLVRPDRDLFDRYLAYPDREPDYRRGRRHGVFTTSLAEAGVLADLPTLGRAISDDIHRRVEHEARG